MVNSGQFSLNNNKNGNSGFEEVDTKVKTKESQVEDKMKETKQKLKDKAHQVGKNFDGSINNKDTQDTSEKLKEKAQDIKEETKSKVEQAKDKFKEYTQDDTTQDSSEEGRAQVTSKDKKNARNQMDKLIQGGKGQILKIKTVFPFEFFSTYIYIDKTEVTIHNYHFITSKVIFPILITDIKTVRVTTSLLFASLKFEISGYEENPQPIHNLKKGDAEKAKMVILGLKKAHENEIDLASFSNSELREKMYELGNKYKDTFI